MPEKSAAGLYEQLSVEREPYLTRGQNNAELTIPSLFPREGHASGSDLQHPHQSVGSRCVTNLSAQMLQTTLPSNSPFFRFNLDGNAAEVLMERLGIKESEISQVMSEYEGDVLVEIENAGFRVTTAQVMDQLVVTGNALVHIPEKGNTRMFRLNRYVCERTPMGDPKRVIVREDLTPAMMEDETIQKHLASIGKKIEDVKTPGASTCPVWTVVTWVGTKVKVHQELGEKTIEGSEATYRADASPWIPVRFDAVDGEAYGRSYVDRFYGDLRTLDGLLRSLDEFAANASKVLWLIKPNSTTRLRTVAKSRSGSVAPGNVDDVGAVQMEKFADFNVARAQADTITERLNHAFLVEQAMVRQAERVTAEEIRMLSQSAQRALSAGYTVLTNEFQLPILNRFIDRMVKSRKLKRLPKKYISQTIVAGAAGLGRDVELQRLDQFVLGTGIPQEILERYVDFGEYMDRRANLLFVDRDNLVYTEEQRAQIAAQKAQEAQQLAATPGAVQAAGNIAQDAAAAAQEEPTE